MQSTESIAKSPTTGRPSRALFDGINIVLLAFVLLCFFMPFVELSCGPIKLGFSGMSLACGTDPDVTAPSPGDRERVLRDLHKDPIPLDIPLIIIPLAAVAGLLLSIRALTQDKQAMLPVMPAILLLVFILYSFGDFGIERKIREEAGKSQGPQVVAVQRAGWFNLGLAASAISLALVIGRKYSPKFAWETASMPVEASGRYDSTRVGGDQSRQGEDSL